ncbi:glycosyltransferase family 2 protein [Acinetobacter sp.]|uniref:glycosyltransferase family 2 protein n=1 Tax=Acinetobacter sp. TaxID=472 RepID=UPI002585DEE9|nr:glycosyltransferase family 2 protein [Acinetobacter sp.]
MKSQDIQVSVCIVTYNQERYIAECLDSLLSQKTNFKFEIIIGEDCSTDSTRGIVQKYVDQYPELVIPLFHEKNVGAVENLKRTYLKAKGKYIAHMDGDDMALPDKLQKQFNVLEKHSELSICSHNVFSITDNRKFQNDFWLHDEGVYDLKAYLREMPFFVHSSKFFVKKYLDNFLLEMNDKTFDFEIHYESIKKGDVFHLNERLGVYRQDVGVTRNKMLRYEIYQSKLNIYEKSFDFFSEKFFLKKIYIKESLKLMKFLIGTLSFLKAISVIRKINKILFYK